MLIRSPLALSAAAVAALFALTLGGCDARCTAACPNSFSASGDVGLPDAEDRDLLVVACVRDDCLTFAVEVTAGSTTCTGVSENTWKHRCRVEMLDASTLSLDIDWVEVGADVGDSATVVVTEELSDVVLLDVATAVASSEHRAVCERECSSAWIDWNML